MKLYAPYCAVYASCLVSAGSLVMLSAALQPSILVMVLPDLRGGVACPADR